MSLDTTYRPKVYDDVLGQEATKEILRQIVHQGKGFQQSYLFAGPKGCGKTTLGRILARALLCESPNGGNPCDKCDPCLSMLSDPPSQECFTEMDAATNSGKEHIQAIVETQRYETFSGKHRVYLIDEVHRLSIHSMDGLLKSLEDTIPGTSDRVLVCIFCTTEPEKVRGTISSRCAPTFVIRKVSPDDISKRISEVCDKEKIEYDTEALHLIAESTQCHVRDSLQAVSGVSMLGGVTVENVRTYLGLDAENLYINILDQLGRDMRKVTEFADKLHEMCAPSTCYAGIADAAMKLFKVKSVGVGAIPTYWDASIVSSIVERDLSLLVSIASWLGAKPGRPSQAMLLCDLATLHERISLGVPLGNNKEVVVIKEVADSSGVEQARSSPPATPKPTASESAPVQSLEPEETPSADSTGTVPPPAEAGSGESYTPVVQDGIYFDERAKANYKPPVDPAEEIPEFDLDAAKAHLRGRVRELRRGRSAGRTNMGHP